MDQVVQDVVGMLKMSVKSFERAFRILDTQTKSDIKLNGDMRMYVDNCRTFVTGLLEWALVSARYKMSLYLKHDGSVPVPL